jgi:hypothetical protein
LAQLAAGSSWKGVSPLEKDCRAKQTTEELRDISQFSPA